MVDDFQWESDAPERVTKFRYETVDHLNSNLLLAGMASVLSTERALSDDKEMAHVMNRTLCALADFESVLAKISVSHREYDEIGRAAKRADDLLAREREHLLQSKITDHMTPGTPEFQATRLVLTEYANHVSLRRFQHRIYRILVTRDLLHERMSPEVFGRTA